MGITNNREKQEHQLKSRLHRLRGQVEGVEKLLNDSDELQVISQFQAVIASAEGALRAYLEIVLEHNQTTPERLQQLLKRVIRR